MPVGESVIISCPGKVLLAGGYLVLDRNHQGFVISTPSRFYTVVQEQEASSSRTDGSNDASGEVGPVKLSVRSPQFDDGVWDYEATRRDGEWQVRQVDTQAPSNSFVHLSLQSTLRVATELNPSAKIRDLLITIVGSNDFYSQSRDDATPIPFAPLHCTIRNVHKTGLGSSAAMVTSLTSSLFLHWTAPGATTDPSQPTVQLMHNLAQYVHSLAQGKIGSGFDVSAAVYGSQVYRRFDVKCLGNLLETDKTENTISSGGLLSVLSPAENPLWSSSDSSAAVSSFCLPPHLTLLLADVDAGSNTPSMVGKVLAWKKAQPEESARVWDELSRTNERLSETFGELRRASEVEHGDSYRQTVADLSRLRASEWSSTPPSSSASSTRFSEAASTILRVRELMRTMGEASDVPIEPPSQTKLLDAVSAIEGVVGAGVPGAGGYDAIWVLCLTPPSDAMSTTSERGPLEKVEALLTSWKEMSVRPLSRNAWVRGSESGTAGSERGLLRQTLEEVEGLREAVERAKAQRIG